MTGVVVGTWILILRLSSIYGVSAVAIPGFKTEEACRQAGDVAAQELGRATYTCIEQR